MAYDKVVDSAALDTQLTSIADAIRAKTGGSASLTLDEMPNEIASIQTGGGGGSSAPVSANDVTFYDYDGTIVASYTIAQAQALTALPDAPTHDGLTFQGWNWSLADINALTRPMNVGAMYITDDGKTRLYIHIADKARSTVPLYISQTVANGVTIDWGDGSATETLAGTGNVNTSHAYGLAGDFTISLDVADGCTLGFGDGSGSYCIMGNAGNNGKVYSNMLKNAEIGSGVASIGYGAFRYCYFLSSITIPNSVTSIGMNAFNNCYSLSSIVIPAGVPSIENNSLSGCRLLSSITIPNSVTSIGDNAFSPCATLDSITIPDSVTSIGNSGISNCSSLSSITIPDSVTSIGTRTFSGCYRLSSIAISSGVHSIVSSEFENCQSIPGITIPDSCTSIAGYTFRYCYSLSSITIPDRVTSIGDSAFYNCYGVAEYHLKPTTPPTLSDTNAFTGIASDCVIYVPQGCLEAYQNATNWATYASYMQEEP